MKYWILSANKKYYDYHKAFEDLTIIDWSDNNRNFRIGDIVYIYSTGPIKKIEFKCRVLDTRIKFNYMIDDSVYYTNSNHIYDENKTFVRLQLVDKFQTDLLSYYKLLENGLKMAPLYPMTLSKELQNYINKVENQINLINQNTHNQKFMIVDLGTGSYNEKHIGHEVFNEKPNPIDGNYYAYVPNDDNVSIQSLGAKDNQTEIDNIIVVFVTKVDFNDKNNIDRVITGIYPNATVYSSPQSGEKLERIIIDKDKTVKVASYSIKSENYISAKKHNLIIETRKFNSYLLRKHRSYSGTYKDLDELIYNYINYIMNDMDYYDEVRFQEDINKSISADEKSLSNAYLRELKTTTLNDRLVVIRDSRLAKSAIKNSNYTCEVDRYHETFYNVKDQPYMEGHHLIPLTINNARYYFNKYRINIDCVENIVSLCPNCHRSIHFGNKKTKKKIIEKLYYKKINDLNSLGIELTLNYLLELYK